MAKDRKKSGSDSKAAKAAKATDPTAQPQHPADGELRFQHVIRNMVVARDQSRKSQERV